MTVKKVVEFLLLRPAITKRNLTSLGLVAVFLCVYVAAGGKVTIEPPKIKPGAGFGTVDTGKNAPVVTGDIQADPSSTRLDPDNRGFGTGRVSNEGKDTGLSSKTKSEEEKKEEKSKADYLAEIEARLKNLRDK